MLNIDELVQYFALFSLVSGVTYYTAKRMKETGVVFTLVIYAKYFVGVSITFFAFYIMYLSSNYFKENGFTILLSLPVGIFVWFIPMHYTTKIFLYLEKRYKKEEG